MSARPPLLVSLVGEQPIPPLLVARHLRPERVVLVASASTRAVAERVCRMLPRDVASVHVVSDEFRIDALDTDFRALLADAPTGTLFDATGATKPMSLALMAQAQRGAEDAFPRHLLYVRTGRDVCVDLYRMPRPYAAPAFETTLTLPRTLSAQDYVIAHVGGFNAEGPSRAQRDPEPGKKGPRKGELTDGGHFEQRVGDVLREAGYDVLAGVRPKSGGSQQEIDLVVVAHNQALLVEVKLGGTDKPKQGLDQLVAAASRERFGIYVKRMLVLMAPLNRSLHDLARAQRVEVVELGGFRADRKAMPAEKAGRLIDAVRSQIGDPR